MHMDYSTTQACLYTQRGPVAITIIYSRVKTQVVSSSIIMHCNKIILLALFSTALAQPNRRASNIPVPPVSIRAQVSRPPIREMQQNLVHINPNDPPRPNTALTKTDTDNRWVYLTPLPLGQMSHRVTPSKTNMHIVDTNQGQYDPGHTVVLNRNGKVDHYAPGTVPKNVVSKESIDLANLIVAEGKMRRAAMQPKQSNSGNRS